MTIADMERFKHVALNIQPEATDVVYAGRMNLTNVLSE